MFKNYFVLNRLINEFNDELSGSVLRQIFSQEKDRIVFHFDKKGEDKFLEISVNPGFPYILLKKRFNRAKKNSVDFFINYLPAKLEHFEIANSDRIIKISFIDNDIYFTIRGKYTNVILVDNKDEIQFFKNLLEGFKTDFLEEIRRIKFIKDFYKSEFPLSEIPNTLDAIRQKYPFIGKEIILEAKRRSTSFNIDKNLVILHKIINEIFYNKPTIYFDENLNEINLSVDTFGIFPFTEKRSFDTFNEALNSYLSDYYSLRHSLTNEKIIRKYLERELARTSAKLNDLHANIVRGSKEEIYSKIGNLLLININFIKKGLTEIELADIYDENKTIKIKLNETYSAKQNVDNYFEKAKNEKVRLAKSEQLYEKYSVQFKKLKLIEEKLGNAKNFEDQNKIMKELNIKRTDNTETKDDLKIKFKHYIVEGKYNVFVGRDSKNNDLLTIKFAKQNDYWFHARSVPGSHVVLKVDNPKEGIPKTILKKAASLAAFHSKAKTSGLAPVSYTLKKYVVKKKGMEPGKVALLKEDVLIVKPEIPSNCEFISTD